MASKRQPLNFCTAAMALVALIPAACKPLVREPSAPAIEFLTDTFDPDDVPVPSEQVNEDGVDLRVSGLCAIDENVAYLFGGVGVAAGTLRSFMLRTTDGGKSWHEVMPPVLGSEVTHVAFPDRRHGWALVMWTVEGPGAIGLFGSTDGGKTWRQLTEIERSPRHAVPDGTPLSMSFKSARNGEIELAYYSGSSTIDDNREEIETLATDDGGTTWSMVRRESREQPPMDAPAARSDHCIDSAHWELMSPAVDQPIITVRRFDRVQKRRSDVTLPTHFKYERGRVVSSR